ncbi:MAG: AI-2E family transporter [Lachnospiraceae bacterium]|nr:AI-2E family transporter [Lachnospiraceae bacterium]
MEEQAIGRAGEAAGNTQNTAGNPGEAIKRDRRKGGGWKKYAGYGVTAFLVIAAAVILVFAFVQRKEFKTGFEKIKSAAAPIIYGSVFAYLMNPLMKFFETKLRHIFYKRAKNITRANKVIRVLSIILTLIFVILLLSFMMYMLIPEITNTVSTLVEELPQQYRNLEKWYLGLEIRNTKAGAFMDNGIVKAGEYIDDFINNRLVEVATDIINPVLSGVKSFFGVIYNVFIGLIFSIYVLGYKEKIIGISKKIVYSLLKRKRANILVRVTRQCHEKFTTSFTGKIIDSFIVGLICFLGMLIFKMPYAVLISVIVGVTNVIPFFGPIIGAIPGSFLIFVVSPIHCLYFVIMIIVIQQLDANVLTPKIVGDSIGLSPIWVLFACVFFGSLWGVLGMLLAVPLMACIYMIVKEFVEYRLYRRGLETGTSYYETLEYEDETEVIRITTNDGSVITQKHNDEEDDDDQTDKADHPSGGSDDRSEAAAENTAAANAGNAHKMTLSRMLFKKIGTFVKRKRGDKKKDHE